MKTNVMKKAAETAAQDALAIPLKALAHPARLAILDILSEGEACVCHIEAALGYRQAYISQQLSVLREANLVQSRQDGWNIYYSLCDERLPRLIDSLYKSLLPDIQRTRLERPVDCPCPKCNVVRTS